MSWLEAIILGIIQGLTEFLPVSSSGHLEIGKVLFSAQTEDSLLFTVVLHGATVLSTLVVFYKEIVQIFKGVFLSLQWNREKQFLLLIIISMIPVLIVGIFFKDVVDSMFSGQLLLVGCALIFTGFLLYITKYIPQKSKKIGYKDAILMGFAQAVAVIPGVSRSGSTISTGLLLGNNKAEVTRFSFLMVIIPILGANALEILQAETGLHHEISSKLLLLGFVAAFISGLFACKWMIQLVKKGKLKYFAIYCFIVGTIAILSTIL